MSNYKIARRIYHALEEGESQLISFEVRAAFVTYYCRQKKKDVFCPKFTTAKDGSSYRIKRVPG